MTATRKRPEVKEPGNRHGTMRDPTDHIREVPAGATGTIRIVCKETLQSLVTTFTNMELEIKVIGSPERQRQWPIMSEESIRSKEMRLLVKNQKENELKEPVMPDKEEATSA
jgi:hypothetical protein